MECTARLLIAGILCSALLPSASATSADPDLREQLLGCLAITTVLRRLDCYDRLARATAATPPPAAEPEQAPDTDTGRTDDAVAGRIERLERRPRGEYVFHLDNGQIWTELEPGRARYSEGAEVLVRRTRMGGYMLSVDGARATRVRQME